MNDIVYYMRTQHNLFGESTAEKIKNQIGAAIEDLETSRRHVCSGKRFTYR
jgi:rod shape-determining protein MreB